MLIPLFFPMFAIIFVVRPAATLKSSFSYSYPKVCQRGKKPVSFVLPPSLLKPSLNTKSLAQILCFGMLFLHGCLRSAFWFYLRLQFGSNLFRTKTKYPVKQEKASLTGSRNPAYLLHFWSLRWFWSSAMPVIFSRTQEKTAWPSGMSSYIICWLLPVTTMNSQTPPAADFSDW